jgi:hypothetical protein
MDSNANLNIELAEHQPGLAFERILGDGVFGAHPLPRKPSLWARVRYRVGQFFRGLTATVDPGEMLIAARLLPKPALVRFSQMPLDAQRHSLDVLQSLQKVGYNHPALASAALLHDVGKIAAESAGYRLNLWLRGPLVLLCALAPSWVPRLAEDDPARGWRYVLYVHLHHPEIGAKWAEADGCSEFTCWLIAHHQDQLLQPPRSYREQLLAVLQWADNQN